MTKLPRYSTGLYFPAGEFRSEENELRYWCKSSDVSALEAECNKKDEVIANQEGELVIYRKKLADTEAENERRREAIKTALLDIAELEAILNRKPEHIMTIEDLDAMAKVDKEQEKQP